MRKIPTIFLRDWDNDPKYVTAEANPECQWVFDGEGTATRKFDGTCVYFDGMSWYARFQLKPGRLRYRPDGFVPIETDEQTGITVGWEPIENSGFAKFHRYALRTEDELFDIPGPWRPGTYELMGPGVSGRYEDVFYFHLIEHGKVPRMLDVPSPISFETLRPFVLEMAAKDGVEGIVWHHPDGRMAKIKSRDFRRD